MSSRSASMLVTAACLAVGCALFAPKQLPLFTGLGVQQVTGPGGGTVAAGELSCHLDQRDYEIAGLSMELQFHACNADPVSIENGRSFLVDPTIVVEPLQPDAEFAPTVHNFAHAFQIGDAGVPTTACVTFRCSAKYRAGDEGDTIDSRWCRGSVMQQRICSGGPSRKAK